VSVVIGFGPHGPLSELFLIKFSMRFERARYPPPFLKVLPTSTREPLQAMHCRINWEHLNDKVLTNPNATAGRKHCAEFIVMRPFRSCANGISLSGFHGKEQLGDETLQPFSF